MIFSVQRFLEDSFRNRGLDDPDQYAIRVANLFDSQHASATPTEFLSALTRLRTAFFRANSQLDRPQFEKRLVALLDRKFKKKSSPSPREFPGGVEPEAKVLRRRARRSIRALLESFRVAVEGRAVDAFWSSRKKAKFALARPETIAQALLAMFFRGVLGGNGLMFREVGSGVGFVDVVIVLARAAHLIELKVLTSSFKGGNQIRRYMTQERRPEGWLVVFDARQSPKDLLPIRLPGGRGSVRIITVDINPTPPSRL